jgi:hypothetical protein
MQEPGHIARYTASLLAANPQADALLGAFLPFLLVLGFALFVLLANRCAKRLPR